MSSEETFVGREAEMRAVLDNVGLRRSTLIIGGAGVGKSAMLRQLAPAFEKMIIDEGIHPPTMYFPLIVHEALMAEPTETEGKEALDEAASIFLNVYDAALRDAETAHARPLTTVIRRPDEVEAARRPHLRWTPEA